MLNEAELRPLRKGLASLTPRRERETMALFVSGLSNKQIAAELGISEITAKAPKPGPGDAQDAVLNSADLVRVAAALDVLLVARMPETKKVSPTPIVQ